MIYLDNAATTAVHPSVVQAMLPYFTETYGNPNSVHAAGNDAAWAVDEAREHIAQALGCEPREVEFTSGGTEADNQALLTGALQGEANGKRHIVSSAIEHPAVLRMLERLQRRGFEVTLVAPDARGVVSDRAIEEALRPDTCLVSLMWVNNEVGSVQPVESVAALCRERGILFHTDAVQAAGLLPIDCATAGIDLLSISAHKFHGPKGAGVLVVRGVEPASLLVGGEQERNHRAGTLNVPGIIGMAQALVEAQEACEANAAHVRTLRDRLVAGLRGIEGVQVLGPAGSGSATSGDAAPVPNQAASGQVTAGQAALNRDSNQAAPGIVSAAFDGLDRETLLVLLDQAGICVSAGSACSAGAVETSHVLQAMGVPDNLARGALRFSIGTDNTTDEIDRALQTVGEIVTHLRERHGGAPLASRATSATSTGNSEGGRA